MVRPISHSLHSHAAPSTLHVASPKSNLPSHLHCFFSQGQLQNFQVPVKEAGAPAPRLPVCTPLSLLSPGRTRGRRPQSYINPAPPPPTSSALSLHTLFSSHNLFSALLPTPSACDWHLSHPRGTMDVVPRLCRTLGRGLVGLSAGLLAMRAVTTPSPCHPISDTDKDVDECARLNVTAENPAIVGFSYTFWPYRSLDKFGPKFIAGRLERALLKT